MGQWNMDQQAVTPQSLLEQKFHLQSAPALSPQKEELSFTLPHKEQNQTRSEKSQLKPQNKSLKMKLLQTSSKKVAKNPPRAMTRYSQLQNDFLRLADKADNVFSTELQIQEHSLPSGC